MKNIVTNPDLADETLVPINKSGGCFPVHVSRPTVERFMRTGKNGVRLESVMIGSRRYTSKEAIARFIERTNRQQNENGCVRKTPKEIQAKKLELGLEGLNASQNVVIMNSQFTKNKEYKNENTNKS